jgi:glutamate-1-semialdehyde 2,1-aminomutase
MERQGTALADGVNEAARDAGVADRMRVIGRPSCAVFQTLDADGAPSQAFRTLFLQEMLLRGVLGQSFVISAAHTDEDVERTVEAVRGALPVYRKALEAGTTDGLLRGRPVAPGHRRFAAPRRLA